MNIVKRSSKKPPSNCSYSSDEFQKWLKETRHEIDNWKPKINNIKEKVFYIRNGICWLEARNGE